VVFGFVFAACSSAAEAPGPAAPAPPADKFDQSIAEAEVIRDKMCTCRDHECGDKVDDDYKAWRTSMKGRFTKDDETKATAAQTTRARGVDNAIRGCRKILPGSRKGAEQAMAKMEEFKDKMCACKDKLCADNVTEEMTKWSQEMAKNADRDVRISEDDTKHMQVVTEEFVKCATAAMTAP